MSNVNEVLDSCMTIEGAFAVALVDFESGLTLGTRCTRNNFDIEVAASGKYAGRSRKNDRHEEPQD